MHLNRKDLTRIQQVLDAFPAAESFELDIDNSSGIGSVVTVTLFCEVNGHHGKFEVEISGVEDW